MKHVLSTLCVLLFPLLAQAGGADVVIENAAVRLVIGADGAARSLIHKSTGEECLARGGADPDLRDYAVPAL